MIYRLVKNTNTNRYLTCLFILILLMLILSVPSQSDEATINLFYYALLLSSSSAIYLLPTYVISLFLIRWPQIKLFFTLLLSSFTIVFVFFDLRLFDLYGFHFNGFVWNLLTTPGGKASLGADQTSTLLILKYLAILLAMIIFSLIMSSLSKEIFLKKKPLLLILFAILIAEKLIYGFAYANVYGPILNQADQLFLHIPMRMNGFLKTAGYEVSARNKQINMNLKGQEKIHYPLNPIVLNSDIAPYNIIMLVAESLRHEDILNERVMPNTMKFSKKYATNFTKHYSGGNGTRQGMFSMFYGLYGTYWDLFLRARKSPLLFDVMQSYEYQYFLYTGARFTYPEFDKTIFASIDSSKLIESKIQEPWKRDRQNVDFLLSNISTRNTEKPFMGFVFFESTHARYSFPENKALEKNYLKNLDYAGLSREDIEPLVDDMKARYINSAHSIDNQLKRVYDYLIDKNMLDNTIVIITGDHGEEFMEHSRWGHNSSFVDQQIHVPMIMSFPSVKPSLRKDMTSHMDIATTLLLSLGVTNPISDFSLGHNLLEETPQRSVVVASWSDLGIVSQKGKLVIPLKTRTQHKNLALDENDIPTDSGAMTVTLAKDVSEVIKNARAFTRH